MEKRDDSDLRLEVKRVRRLRTSVKAGICYETYDGGEYEPPPPKPPTCSNNTNKSVNTRNFSWKNHNARQAF